MGTVHVLEASRQSSTVRSVVVVTSDKCYANREQQAAYGEDDPLGGYDPYSASKGCAELAAAAYRCSFGRPHGRVATARAGNVIGGGDCAADRLVPDLVRSIAARQPCRLRRSDAVRPWQHVLEALSGYLMLGHRLMEDPERFASAWNFGPDPDDTATVGEVARQFAACWGKGCLVETAREQGPHEANVLRLDSSKANRELAWQPLLTMPERIAWTVAWYRTWQRRPESVWRITARQIDAYEERIRQCPELLRLWWPASTASSARPSHAA
jgi:CDP-glucose 4,6-dehydratase